MVFSQYSVCCLVAVAVSPVGRPETQRYCVTVVVVISLSSPSLLPSGLSLSQFFFSFLGPCGARRCGCEDPGTDRSETPVHTLAGDTGRAGRGAFC